MEPPDSPAPADGPLRTWTLTYDANKAEVTSITDPMGLKSTFLTKTYSVYTETPNAKPDLVRGVYQVDQVDMSGKSSAVRTLKWERTMPTFSAKNLVTVVASNATASVAPAPTPDRSIKYVYGNATDRNVRDFKNGFLSQVILQDASSAALETRTYTSKSTGGGLNGQLSMVETATTNRAGAIPLKREYAYLSSNLLQVSKITTSAANSSAAWFKAEEKSFTYDSLWGMLDPHRVASTQTTRFDVVTGAALAGGMTSRQTWDQWNGSIPPKLQLLESFLEAGTSKHGSAYTYDTEGRLATQAVLHVENGNSVASPNTLTLTYDSATGLPVAREVSYQEGSGSASLTKTRGEFDGGLRPTLYTDEKGVSTRLAYDLYGRPLSLAKDGEAGISLSYPDEWSTLTTQAGKTTADYYDGFGRRIRTVRPDGISVVPSYDLNGRVVQVQETNPVGSVRTSTASYDLLDRVLSRTSAAGKREDFSYALGGNPFLKITSSVDPLGLNLVTTTRVDPFGQVASVKAPNGDTTSYEYDGRGNKTRVTMTPASGGTAQVRTFSYDALGRLVSKTEPETGTQVFSSFNALNQPRVVTERGIDLTKPPRNRALEFDGLGRLRTQVGGSVLEHFVYQGPFLTETGRLAGTAEVRQSFTYDGPGRRLSQETTTAPLGQ